MDTWQFLYAISYYKITDKVHIVIQILSDSLFTFHQSIISENIRLIFVIQTSIKWNTELES